MSSTPGPALVGNPNVVRRDTLAKVQGTKKFTSDIHPTDVGIAATTGFVYMAYVTSPYPNALINSIDVSAAEAAGAVTLTGYDYDFLPPYTYYSTSGNRFRGPLPTTQARYAGCPVVAVGADTPDLLNDAIGLVKVDFTPLPYVFDVEEALQSTAPQIWPGGNSPGGSVTEGVTQPSTSVMQFGNADAAIAAADQVVTVRLDTQFIQHMDIEPRGLIAQWASVSEGLINIWGNTQYAASLKTTVANYFGVPLANVTIRTSLGGFENASIGCGLGNKSSGEEYIIATAMSKKAGGAVKFLQTRYTNSLATTNRYPERAYVTAAAKNGIITAFKGEVFANVGANGGANSDLGEFYVIYNVNNVNMVSYSSNSNAYGLAGPMRDVGESQNSYFVETCVDMLAEKYNMDPAAFRLQNMRTAAYTDNTTNPPTVYPNTAFDHSTGYPFSGYGQPAAHLMATSTFGWSSRWKGWGVPSNVLTNSGETVGTGMKLRGVGISLTSGSKGALSAPDTGQINVVPNGTVTVYSGGMDHGGGGVTALPIIAAEAIGLPNMNNVKCVFSDTSLTTDTGVTAGSRMTRNGGIGLVAAAQNLATQWFPLLVPKMAAGTKATNLAFGGGDTGQPSGIIYDKTNPTNQITFAAACALLPAAGLTGIGSYTPPARTAYRVGGTKICEVEVDVETADVRVIDYVGGLGLGRVIFAKGADAQNQGGMIGLGIGEALFEQSLNDSSTGLKYSGGTLNPNYLDNKIPTMYQAPERALSLWAEYKDAYGPFGAVGIGENTLMSVIPMILNALSNALGGYRFTKVPVRKEEIVAALQWLKEQPNSPI